MFKQTDVADVDQIQALVDFATGTFGGLDVMFNNAGIASSFRRFLRDDFRDLERVLAVNLMGVIFGSQRAARTWLTRRRFDHQHVVDRRAHGGWASRSPTARPKRPSSCSAGSSPPIWPSTACG